MYFALSFATTIRDLFMFYCLFGWLVVAIVFRLRCMLLDWNVDLLW